MVTVKQMFIFVCIACFSIILLGYMHERVHIAIYEMDGIEAHAEYFSHFPHFVTIPDEPCKTEICRLSHNMNEVVGYHLTAVFVAFVLFWMFKMCKDEEDEYYF